MSKFWIVWTLGHTPNAKYDSEEDAQHAAMQMAADPINRNRDLFVLEAKSGWQVAATHRQVVLLRRELLETQDSCNSSFYTLQV